MKRFLPPAYARYRIDSEIKPDLTAKYRSIKLSTVYSSIVLRNRRATHSQDLVKGENPKCYLNGHAYLH